MHRERHRPPGLYFGAAGIAWALADAGAALGDERLVERAVALALVQPPRLAEPRRHPRGSRPRAGAPAPLAPDGRHRADRARGSERRRPRRTCGARCARRRLARPARLRFALRGQALTRLRARHRRHRPVPARHRPGDGTHRPRRPGPGRRRRPPRGRRDVTGGLAWPSELEGPQTPMPYWCNGSAGVGAFLVRLHDETGDPRYRCAADGAARAVMHHKWRLGPGLLPRARRQRRFPARSRRALPPLGGGPCFDRLVQARAAWWARRVL